MGFFHVSVLRLHHEGKINECSNCAPGWSSEIIIRDISGVAGIRRFKEYHLSLIVSYSAVFYSPMYDEKFPFF
jgi:hypothetical protein